MRANEFILEAYGKKTDQDTIDLVKLGWDEGKTPTAIAADLGLTVDVVKHILVRYYPSRLGKVLKLASALTDDDKNTIVSRFLNQETASNIARDYGIPYQTIIRVLKSKLGVDKFNDMLTTRKKSSGVNISNKITPEILNKIKELYVAGKSLRDISAHLDNLISGNNVYMAMIRQPDYAELRAKRDERTRKVKHDPVVTTKIHRPGVIDPQGVHGPNSRHRSGVNWQKLN